MYNVSQTYRNAMYDHIQHHRLSGTIGNLSFTDNNILAGSLQILQQCSGSNEVQIGQVMIGELTGTFRGLNIPRGSWQGKTITVIFELLTDSVHNTWEQVPVGVFTISEANWSASGMTVKAYDNMSKLDKRCNQRFVSAKPYMMLNYACTQCGLQLGNTQEEIEAMPNGTDVMTEYEDNDIDTWRDFVSWLSQTLGGFAFAGKDGKIYIKQYTRNYVDIIDENHRHLGAVFSDFETKYTGMSVVNIKYGTTNYYSVGTDDGLTYNLGQNPFLQNYENGTERRGRILEALKQIKYTPFSLNMIGNIAYDLGDVLKFIGGIAGDDGVICCITKMVYKHKQGISISGVGKDPSSASPQSKTDKNISGLLNKVSSNEFRFVKWTNGYEVDIGNEHSTRIMTVDLQTAESSQVSVNSEILLEVTQTNSNVPVECVVTYRLDGEEDVFRYPTETYITGKHILTLQNYLEPGQGTHRYEIYLTLTGGTGHIDELGILNVFNGSGLIVSSFDGTVYVDEEFDDFDMPEIDFVEMEDDDSPTLSMIEVRSHSIADEIDVVNIEDLSFDLEDAEDEVLIALEIPSAQRITEIDENRLTENNESRYTEGETWQIQ